MSAGKARFRIDEHRLDKGRTDAFYFSAISGGVFMFSTLKIIMLFH